MRFRRRDFLVLLGAMITTQRAFAQKTVPRLCFLTFDPGTAEAPTERFKGFFERLRELGYVHPQSIHIDYTSRPRVVQINIPHWRNNASLCTPTSSLSPQPQVRTP